MNKKVLTQEISKMTKHPQNQVDEVLKGFMDVVTKALENGERVTLVGFGTFMVKHRKATTGINPHTREKIKIPSKNYAKLQFSDKINDMLN